MIALNELGEVLFSEIPEREYSKSVSYNYRKKLGQFFTPIFIADLMTDWIVNSQNGGLNRVEILDPALGLGVFFSLNYKTASN